jgi:outer membrane receptor protein involved in Fe transport
LLDARSRRSAKPEKPSSRTRSRQRRNVRSLTNPFLPAATLAQLQAGLPAGATKFYLSRASTDIVGSNSVKSETETGRVVLGLEGDFKALDRDFNWDVSLNKGVVDGNFSQPGINQAKFAYAVDAISSGGQIVCRVSTLASTDPAAAGCAPLNLFGYGSPSAAAVNYIYAPFTNEFLRDETDFLANFGGTIWKLPAGKASFNAGYEYRRESGKFAPGDNALKGVGRSVPISQVSGKFHTEEEYVEATVPIFGPDFNFPLARRLDFDAAYRKVDNSLAGTNEVHSLGAKWSPFHDLTLRMSNGQTFRAPAITELYLPQSSAFSTATDPCDFTNINAGPNPTARAANCAATFKALGLPTNYKLVSNVQAATIQIVTGGNPKLGNETAKNASVGFIYQPHFIPNLTISADHIKTHIANAISSFSLTSILSVCYDSPTPAPACNNFTRDANAQVVSATTGYVNASYIRFSGDTVSIDYHFEPKYLPLPNTIPGNIDANLAVFHYDEYKPSVTGGGFDQINSRNTPGTPDWSYQFNLTYANDKMKLFWTNQYQDAVRIDRTTPGTVRAYRRYADYFLDSIGGEVTVRKNFVFRAGINNLFDVQPPFPTTGINIYDLVGRQYYAGLRASF